MHRQTSLIFPVVLMLAAYALAQNPSPANAATPAGSIAARPVELARHEKEFSSARIEPAQMQGRKGIAIIFEGTDDLHYYANAETAPAGGLELEVEPKSDDFSFAQPIFPKWGIIRDPLGKKVEVYVGRFTVFVPIDAVKAPTKTTVIDQGDIKVKISGIACTSMICLPPFEKTLHARINWSQRDSWKQISFEKAAAARVVKGPTYSVWFALGLAFLAGLSLNIMPCVWPVLPLIVMRIVEQAKQSKARSVGMGLAFCIGILLFFACLAGANIVLQLFYGTVLQWGDQFRNPAFVAGMALLLVVLALFMFGVFTIGVPSAITGKSGSGRGYSGAVGMGFLAAVLSTPCSFGILAAAFAWAQGQPLPLGTFAIMVIGIGMAVPYAVLTSMPGLLNRLPKAGRWMELFKQAIGFILLIIAVKLISALPEVRKMGVLYFAVILGFCIWMWGTWVTYNTKPSRKYLMRILAVALAVAAGWVFLPAPAELIDWQSYDIDLIEPALAQKRPVLIEFTADWCFNCLVVDKIVYSRKDIAKLIEKKGVLAIKADTTEKDHPATLALKRKYAEPGVPVTVLHLPDGTEPHLRGLINKKDLKKILNDLPDSES